MICLPFDAILQQGIERISPGSVVTAKPAANGRLWEKSLSTAGAGDFLFTTLFQNARQRKPGLKRP